LTRSSPRSYGNKRKKKEATLKKKGGREKLDRRPTEKGEAEGKWGGGFCRNMHYVQSTHEKIKLKSRESLRKVQ